MRILSAFLFMVFSSYIFSAQLQNIVIFGDSLSDNGNFYRYTQNKVPHSPTYYEGRFSNGPVWAEHLTTSYFPSPNTNHLFNYAFGGASVAVAKQAALFTLKSEIDTYLLANNGAADPNSLIIVWIGANNYLVLPDNLSEVAVAVDQGIQQGLQTLVTAGAKNIMVLNLPYLGNTPFAREVGMEDSLNEVTKQHNQLLENTIANLKSLNPEVQWLLFDVQTSLDDLFLNSAKYGFHNVVDSYLDTQITDSSKNSMVKVAVETSPQNNAYCTGYLFFDAIHPTALAHVILAKNVREFLNAAEISFANLDQ